MQSPIIDRSSSNEFPHSSSQQYDDSDSDSDLSLTDYKDHLIQQHQSKMPKLPKSVISVSTLSLPLSEGLEEKHQDAGLSPSGEVDANTGRQSTGSTNVSTTVSPPSANLTGPRGSIRRKPPPDLLDHSQQEHGKNQEARNTSIMEESKNDSLPSTLAQDTKARGLKRFSAGKLNNWGKMVSSLKRSTSMRTFDAPETESHTYRRPPVTDSILQTPTFESPKSSLTTSLPTPITTSEMPFWKYHILRFGKDLYLTTNPGTKYVHCRNGPSFYVEVVVESTQNLDIKSNGEEYTLTFKDPSNLSQDPRQCMVISKKHDQQKDYFSIRTPKNTYLADDGTVERYEDLTMFKTVSFPLTIDKKYFPYDALRKEKPMAFTNYELKDLVNKTWNVGSIARVKTSRFNKIRQSVRNASKEINDRSDQEELKLVDKRNIYFHRNYINNKSDRKEEYNTKNIYDASTDFPLVLSMFRPNENRISKRLVQSMKQQQRSRQQSSVHTAQDDFESNQNDTKTFYNGSDGLYYLHDTHDDNPDENKLGWITIYEDREVFGGIENRGMFDIVLGMTLAVGFDTYLKDHKAAKR